MNNSCFSIRDDDINFFTNVESLQRFYEPKFEWLRPTLCVTPRAGYIYNCIRKKEFELIDSRSKFEFAKKMMNEDKTLSNVFHNIYDNDKLIKVLQEWVREGLVEIALHGITHNPGDFAYECELDNVSEVLLKKEIYELEKAVGTKITLFSPPNNSMSKYWVNLVSRCGMNIVHSAGLRPNEILINLNSVLSTVKIASVFFLTRKKRRVLHPLDYGGFKLMPSYPTSPISNNKMLFKQMDFVNARGGFFVLATHSYCFENDRVFMDEVSELVFYAKKIGFNFKTISQGINETKF